jgi:hypothetical protein
MGKSSSPPPAPDPAATANAQAGYDKATAGYNAALNRYNVSTPYGSLDWTQSGTDPATGAPMYSQKVNLTPASQATLTQDQNNALGLATTQGQMLGNASAGMASPIDVNGISSVQRGVSDYGPGYVSNVADQGPGYAGSVTGGPGYAGPVAQGNLTGLANQATNAAYGSSMALLQPQMDIDRKAAQTDLANRGIPMGSEGYNNQMGTLDRSQDFTRTQAANNATLTGMQYDNQLFNQGAQNANFQNTAQQGMFSQGMANAGLQNTAQAGMFSQGLNNANLQNNAQQSGFNQALAQGNYANSAQAQAMQQYLGLRQEPLNEYNAMMNGTQVQTPQFQATPVTNANAPNYAGAVAQNYQGQLNAYNAQTGGNNSFLSGLMGIGGAALGAPMGTFPAIGRALGM